MLKSFMFFKQKTNQKCYRYNNKNYSRNDTFFHVKIVHGFQEKDKQKTYRYNNKN